MKDSVTKFDFDDAFKALDEIEIPVAEKGIRANRVDLKESMKKVDKFELLFEDFYDVNNADDMNTVSEEREAEVAKAKLARIEKIVDLNAETEDDILPSYVGKTIIQCPQCMTLFYKDAEDIVRDEENPDVVNVNEVCQHCGNESGYDVVGKVAEETEAASDDELGTDDFSAEVGDGENDIAIDDGSETTEEAPAEEDGEVDELSAEADLDSLDLDTELDLEEEPVEEEEANESLNTSELLKKIEDKNELKTENESEKLTLNEDADLNKQLDLYNDFIKYLQNIVEQDEEALERAKKQGNKEVIAAIQKRLDNSKAELEAALPETVKNEADTEELPDATEAGMEDATDNTSDEIEATNDETEETTESLQEAVESMTDTLNRAWEVAKKTNSPIGVTVVTPIGAGTMDKLKGWSKTVNANLYYVDAKNPDLMVNGFDENMISRPDTIIVIDEFDRAPANTQKAISDEVDYLDTQVEMVIVISHNSNLGNDNFKRFKQYVAVVEKETATESLTESITNVSETDINKLFNSEEFKKPVSEEEIESYFESVDADLEDAEVNVEGDTNPVEPTEQQEDQEALTEAGGFFDKLFGATAGQILTIAQNSEYNKLVAIAYLDPTTVFNSKTKKPCETKIDDEKLLQYPLALASMPDVTINAENKKDTKKNVNKMLDNVKAAGKKRYNVADYTNTSGISCLVDKSTVHEIRLYLTQNIGSNTNLKEFSNAKSTIAGGSKILLIGIYNVSKEKFDFKAEGKGGLKQASTELKQGTETIVNAEHIVALVKDKKQLAIIVQGRDNNYRCIKKDISISSTDDLNKCIEEAGEYAKKESGKVIVTVASDSLPTDSTYKEVDVAALEKTVLYIFDGAQKESKFSSFYNNHKEKTEAFDITDIDENSFNKNLTESLTEVYDNVKSFSMTDCTLKESTLTITGNITFNSGKVRTTQYVFEAAPKTNTNLVRLTGVNKDLFNSGSIKMNCLVLNEALLSKTIKYKYTINENLVEGIIKHK